jgi:hypothetical protein
LNVHKICRILYPKEAKETSKKEESNNAVSGLKLFIGGQDHKHNRGLDIAK